MGYNWDWKENVARRLFDGDRFQVTFPTYIEAESRFIEFKHYWSRLPKSYPSRTCWLKGELHVEFCGGVVYFDSELRGERNL